MHQIELEMQNEELQRAQAAAEEASEKYCDLFDFAPVGYFLWDHDGRILEVNLAGAALLGLDRSAVIQKRFGQFVAVEYRAAFADFCQRVLATDAKQTCEVKLLKTGRRSMCWSRASPPRTARGKRDSAVRRSSTDVAQCAAAQRRSAGPRSSSPGRHLPGTAVFNPEEALTRCFNSRDMVREMIQCFFDEVDNLFPQMRAALEKGDLVEVGRLGHRMKGTVVYLGADQQEKPHCAWSDSASRAAAPHPKPRKPSTHLSTSASR